LDDVKGSWQEPMVFVRVWQYLVDPDEATRFKSAYGPDGEWAQLFERGTGYLDTTLHQDLGNSVRFLTVDRWESERAWRDFHATHLAEYTQLDKRLRRLTTEQHSIIEATTASS
jgi:heme-degrading monooxygenase HmoA